MSADDGGAICRQLERSLCGLGGGVRLDAVVIRWLTLWAGF